MNPLRTARVAGFLAARSIARGNAGVTIMSVVMMTVVFISISFLPALIGGAVESIDEQVTNTLTGDLTISSAGTATIDHSTSYLKEVRAQPGVAAATGTRRVGNQIAFGPESNAWGVDAIDPSSFGKVFSTPRNLVEGEFLSTGDTEGIVLGIDIAGAGQKNLRSYSTSLKTVHVGDKVTVTMIGGTTAAFTVRGIYNNDFALSDAGAYITTAAADALIPSADYASTVKDMYSAFDSLSAAFGGANQQANQLADGAAGLAAGADSLASSASSTTSGAGAVGSSSAQLAAGAVQLAASGQQLAQSAQALAAAVGQISSELAGTVTASAQSTAAAAASAADDSAALVSSCSGSATPGFCAELSSNSDAVAAVAASASATAGLVGVSATEASAASAAASALASQAGQLAASIGALAASAQQLEGGASSVSTGAQGLVGGARSTAAAAGSLSLGAQQLAAGLAAGQAGIPATDQGAEDSLIAILDAAAGGPGKDTVSRIIVKADEGVASTSLESSLRPLRSDVEFQTPEQLASAIQDQIDTFDLINQIMQVISLLVAAITVFIITYVDLTNRRRQIGIERAIGIRSGAIVGSYVLKSIFTAAIGTVLGSVVFRFALVPLVQRFPFSFPNGPVVLVDDPARTVRTVAILMIVASVAALVPAIQTVRMKILDAIWGN